MGIPIESTIVGILGLDPGWAGFDGVCVVPLDMDCAWGESVVTDLASGVPVMSSGVPFPFSSSLGACLLNFTFGLWVYAGLA
jgi:hypothetical protein